MSAELKDLGGDGCPGCGVTLGLAEHAPACGFSPFADARARHDAQRAYDIHDVADADCACHDCLRWHQWYQDQMDDAYGVEYAIPEKSQAEPR
jgi:hypothetical protein